MAASGKKNMFNEATRVQMPAMVHLTRLGYTYFGKITEDMAGTVYDPDTNILINVFKEQFARLNPTHTGEAEQTLKTIRQELDNDDIGRSFYERLSSVSPVRLVDFENPKNNTYHFTAEFTCKRDQDEFRPDITLFVNGLPLVFVEVKKPNNHGGMVAESKRMNQKRFPNKKFRRFLNITQLMIFSNNMEYDTMGGIVPVQGAFYCTTAKQSAPFNCFREENPTNLDIAPYNADFPYKDIDPIVEKKILTDFNCQVIHTSPEYQTNLDTYTPTNRVLTSMCSPERLLFILKYGIAYVRFHKEINGKIEFIEQKHIMRYQQMFAALTVRSKIDEGVNSGVIWHTQGSGKTALSYYLTYVLSDYFSKQNKVAKFYFIVDRLDLLKQASEEFEARGLVVKTASSRAELMEQFRNNQAQEGNTGKPEITVVNIQRFAEDRSKVDLPAYATNLQRVFIIDEAHRGYKPEGSFLANLLDADKNAIKIALTGTPLLKEERESWRVFGNYIHTYYYDKSILDGYTLKIIREDIETQYKERLSEIYEKLETLVEKKDVKKSQIVEHDNYVKELLRYIISDLKRFRQIQGDNTLGGMVICETSEQARKLFAYFDEIQAELNKDASMKSHLRAGLILHDSDDKDTRDTSPEKIYDVEVEIPDVISQQKIANLLWSIDEKIANNNAINDNLEQQAKLLYNYWFIQFNFPDENGNPYHSSGGQLVWNKNLQQEIPQDWRSGNLYDIADYINGIACQKYRPSDEEHSLPVVKIREMNGGITNDTERVSSTIPAKNIISSGDILFSWSASLEVIMWYGVDAGLNQHIFKVVPKSYFSSEYVYLQLSEYLIHFIKIAEARKTTMGHITSEHLQDSHIILPPANIIKNFSEYVRPIYQMKKQIANETSELIKLRDWLIPMLMNGQATISD